mmetsp:Transcript_4391/g.11487  ORF Transcript_4391/g.11487 Transcript_4391/m.11487 type:complete len:321 (-) Transcript_4391:140-1102(-)
MRRYLCCHAVSAAVGCAAAAHRRDLGSDAVPRVLLPYGHLRAGAIRHGHRARHFEQLFSQRCWRRRRTCVYGAHCAGCIPISALSRPYRHTQAVEALPRARHATELIERATRRRARDTHTHRRPLARLCAHGGGPVEWRCAGCRHIRRAERDQARFDLPADWVGVRLGGHIDHSRAPVGEAGHWLATLAPAHPPERPAALRRNLHHVRRHYCVRAAAARTAQWRRPPSALGAAGTPDATTGAPCVPRVAPSPKLTRDVRWQPRQLTFTSRHCATVGAAPAFARSEFALERGVVRACMGMAAGDLIQRSDGGCTGQNSEYP